MTPNPKPRYCIPLKYADGTVAKRDSHRPDVFLLIDALEMQGWVKGILRP